MAMCFTRLVSIGNRLSFFSSTIDLRATSSAVFISSALPTDLVFATALSIGLTVRRTRRISRTRWLITLSLTFPAFTESSKALPIYRLPGISTFIPVVTASTVECTPPQSLITIPGNPHCWRSMVVCSCIFSEHQRPFTLLYAAINPQASASRTAISNGRRYISCMARSEIRTSTKPR